MSKAVINGVKINNFSDLIKVAKDVDTAPYDIDHWSDTQKRLVDLGQKMQAKIVEDYRKEVKEIMDSLDHQGQSMYVPMLQLYISVLHDYLYNINYSYRECSQEPLWGCYDGNIYEYLRDIDLTDRSDKYFYFKRAFITCFVLYCANISELVFMTNEEIDDNSPYYVDADSVFLDNQEYFQKLSKPHKRAFNVLCKILDFEDLAVEID